MKRPTILSLSRVIAVIFLLMTCCVGYQDNVSGQLLRRNRCSSWQQNRCRRPLLRINRVRSCPPVCCANSCGCNPCRTSQTTAYSCTVYMASVAYCPTRHLYRIGANYVHEMKDDCNYDPKVETFNSWKTPLGCNLVTRQCLCSGCNAFTDPVDQVDASMTAVPESGVTLLYHEEEGDQLYVRDGETAAVGYRIIWHSAEGFTGWTAILSTIPPEPRRDNQTVIDEFDIVMNPPKTGRQPRCDEIQFMFNSVPVRALRLKD